MATFFLLGAYALLPVVVGALCTTDSQPNPIANQYPNMSTGTINGTVAVLPIPYSLARQIVPSEYSILRDAYLSLLPDFPEDMYPAMLQSELDHDIRSGALSIPDFTRSSISFPFVDRLGDGYTAMTYGNQILVSALNAVAILGTQLYGYTVTPAYFQPDCNAYKCASDEDNCETKYFAAYSPLKLFSGPKISHNFTASSQNSPFSLAYFKNITNQPQFSNNKLFCDNYIRLFNTSVTLSPYEPTVVQGTVSAVAPIFPVTTTWTGVWGLQMDNAFIENNYLSCESLQGYTFSD